jgi:hypothetical protein
MVLFLYSPIGLLLYHGVSYFLTMTRGRVWNLIRIFIDIPLEFLSYGVCHQMSISKSDPALRSALPALT